ncbi:MAG: hypothetical protein C0519_01865 [Hyphomicrobium sp.]|jgi:hypothetical protein|nr:hypothetical protein [Hyphomicrobium sp.]PPD09472.1 MAG: hypothetical protein CTY28_01240 [Hyphomicrobium sp.]
MTPTIAGVLALALPLLLLGLLILRRNGAVFLFYVVLCAVGIGYLVTTGAADDIGTQVLDLIGQATSEKAAEPATPAPATP